MAILLLTLLSVLSPVQQQSTVPLAGAAMFDQGKTFEDFLATADARPEVWKANAARSKPAKELVDRLAKASGGNLRLLVVAVAACSDSVQTVPYVAALAKEAGVPLRIVDSTVGKAIMEAYRTPDGRAATATIAVLRGDRVAGAWVERPEGLQSWMIGPAQALAQSERMERKTAWYEWDRGESTMAELVSLVERLR